MLGHTDAPAMVADCPQIAARTATLPIARIVASDLTRASAQATVLAKRCSVPLTLDPAWRELDFGAWDGHAPDDLPALALAAFWNDPEAQAPPGGERWSDLCARVVGALDRLESDTLVVTHAGAMRAALAVLTGLDHRGIWALDLPYRALLSLRIWPGTPLTGHVTGLVT